MRKHPLARLGLGACQADRDGRLSFARCRACDEQDLYRFDIERNSIEVRSDRRPSTN